MNRIERNKEIRNMRKIRNRRRVIRNLIGFIGFLGFVIILGAAGHSDYMDAIGEYYPLSALIKTSLIGVVMIIPSAFFIKE